VCYKEQLLCVVLWWSPWSASLADEPVTAAQRLWETFRYQSWGWRENSPRIAGTFLLTALQCVRQTKYMWLLIV